MLLGALNSYTKFRNYFYANLLALFPDFIILTEYFEFKMPLSLDVAINQSQVRIQGSSWARLHVKPNPGKLEKTILFFNRILELQEVL